MPGRRLLIVEDCEPVAQLLKTTLADDFPEVHTANSLAAARRHLRLDGDAPVDLVICSQTLPDGEGEDFKLWIDARRPGNDRTMPFVLIAGSLPGLRRTGAGFVILSKPFLVEDLLRAMREARTLAGHSPATE